MNRKERRALQKQQHAFAERLPDKLTLVPREEFPAMPVLPLQAWRSRKYLVELWAVDNPQYPYMVRLSICRVKLGNNGRWHDGLTWDELQAIKAEVWVWELVRRGNLPARCQSRQRRELPAPLADARATVDWLLVDDSA